MLADLRILGIWLSRATGIGYRSYPPLEEVIEPEKASEARRKADYLVRELDELEREIRNRGRS